MEVRLHPYPFKGRIFRRFSGLLVIILRHMREIHELDFKIAEPASKIEKLRAELKEIRSKAGKGNLKVMKKAKSLQKSVNDKARKINNAINSFCSNVRKEVEDFMRIKINSDTLHYREALYLRHFVKILIRSKMIDDKHIETLKRGIEGERRSLKRKAGALELQGKHLERGGVNTVIFSQISPWGNRWIERRIRVRAIEINALHKRFKNDTPEALLDDFEKEITDIYEIGRNVIMLMRRLEISFNSLRIRLKNAGISSSELNKTERFFKRKFRRIARMGKFLYNEIKSQSNKLKKSTGKLGNKGKIIELYPGIEQVNRKAA